jgi:hypothetical protein
MNKAIGLNRYLTTLIMGILLILLLLSTICVNGGLLESLVTESIVFGIATVFFSSTLLGDRKLTKFFLWAYLIKLLIGIFHYLIFIDPDYFNSTGEFIKLHHEYQAVYHTVNTIVEGKKSLGLFSLIMPMYIPHEELWNIIAIPLCYCGNNVLNITPINSFVSLFAAMNILLVCKQNGTNNSSNSNLIKYFLAYFPFTLITSFYARDLTGWCLMSIGLVLLYLPKHVLTKSIMLAASCYLFYLQRNAYALVPIVMFLMNYLIVEKNKNFLVQLLAILVCVLCLPFAYFLFATETNMGYVEDSTKWPIYMLPIKILFGLIGAFPWTNFPNWHTRPEYSYYLSDYLMAVVNIGFLITLFKSLPIKSFKRTLDISCIAGIVLFVFGLMNSYMHMSYISVGIFFMTPWIFRISNDKSIARNLKIAFMLLVLLNIFVMLTGVSSLSSSVK